jgi:hypothetical protein
MSGRKQIVDTETLSEPHNFLDEEDICFLVLTFIETYLISLIADPVFIEIYLISFDTSSSRIDWNDLTRLALKSSNVHIFLSSLSLHKVKRQC